MKHLLQKQGGECFLSKKIVDTLNKGKNNSVKQLVQTQRKKDL
jgi:hypothetical protein